MFECCDISLQADSWRVVHDSQFKYKSSNDTKATWGSLTHSLTPQDVNSFTTTQSEFPSIYGTPRFNNVCQDVTIGPCSEPVVLLVSPVYAKVML
jgi:hypothetical protein